MSRNFGAGTRDMASAARILLNRSRVSSGLAFGSVDVVADRFRQFVKFCKLRGVGRLEKINWTFAREYGLDLAGHVDCGEIAPAYAHNLISSVNSVMQLVTNWTPLSATRDCGIRNRSAIRQNVPRGYGLDEFDDAVSNLETQRLIRQAAIARLAREINLRSKEASLLDAVDALKSIEKGVLVVTAGTKGGRRREIPIVTERQASALRMAAHLQATGRNLIPDSMSWKTWREGGLRFGREALQLSGIGGYHELRAAYACQRYFELTGALAPVFGDRVQNKGVDLHARKVISAELGHGRVDVVAEYIGGRR